MDNNYGLIRIFRNDVIEFHYFCYENNNYTNKQYPICFSAGCNDINYLFYILSLSFQFNVLSTQHKLYFGKEILKAKISVILRQYYIQE
uniref:Uncharacterized protein n=1 Tax=Ophidocladus simpliciusculus TaxID=1261574 RepID=A0A1Z1MJM5_9FLOR|nr:hypothetical protein [Ophidocladus simpliciusculus]ARW65961.1 hypothetical protein [Ophidocladus simpliciusculus]